MACRSVISSSKPLSDFNSTEAKAALNIPEVLLKIFIHLNMQELRSTSLVCRDWRHIINNHEAILSQLLPKLNKNSNFLKEFNIIYSNVEKFEESDFYLVGERHDSQICRELFNSLVTRLIVHHRVIVLIEGSPSMEKITENFDLWIQAYNIPAALREKVTFIGWDFEELDSIGNCSQVQHSLGKQIIQCSKWIVEITQEIFEITPEVSDEALLKLSIPDLESVDNLMQQLTKVKKMQKNFQSEFDKGLVTEEELLKTFPARTACMIKTLNTIQFMLQSGELIAKIVLQSGQLHLRTFQEFIHTPEFQLDELYRTLDSLKATVMIPNQIMDF